MICASRTRTPGLGRLLASAPGPGAIAVAVAGGLGTEDKPVFPGMHEASALVAGDPGSGPRRLARIGRARGEHLGGMHHAMARSHPRFGVYNDPAIASPGCLGRYRARRLRGHRRARRRRGTGSVLCRSAGANYQPARAPGDPVPPHRAPTLGCHGCPRVQGLGGEHGDRHRPAPRRPSARHERDL
jgi:hypothetical protein